MFFDVANRQNCTVRQPRTNTPLHALATMNDVTYVEASRVLGERLLRSANTDRARVAFGIRLCLGRVAAENELALLSDSLQRLRQQFASEPEAARRLIEHGESKPSSDLPPAELAAFTALGNLFLNLDETLTKE
jgi:hypothetical protein